MSARPNELVSVDACTGDVVWRGVAATEADVARAVAAARQAQAAWADQPIERRQGVLRAFGEGVRASAELLDAICRETGKPRTEARSEVESMAAKAGISIDMHGRRLAETAESVGAAAGGRPIVGRVRHRPLGVVGVIGPFNFPGHLPNGHIVPALLAGDAVVFKPSEITPRVAEVTAAIWAAAGLPSGVLGLVQGGREVAEALLRQPVDGLFFTGSEAAGRSIHRALAGRPEVLCALEMGGNNPLVVCDAADADAAAEMIVTSAFATAGQRCSCARRLILVDGPGIGAVMERLIERTRAVRVGTPDDKPEPNIGPVISPAAAERALEAQRRLLAAGGKSIVEMRTIPNARRSNFLSPGLVDVSAVADPPDEEVFAPLLSVMHVADFNAAIAEANRTRFGLSAGLISDRAELREPFARRVRAGVIHFNRPLTGASSKLPFGGLGASGNHRPSAAYAADYCADAVAVVEG